MVPHDCCCGNPECTYEDDLLKLWGIPAHLVTRVELEVPLEEKVEDEQV